MAMCSYKILQKKEYKKLKAGKKSLLTTERVCKLNEIEFCFDASSRKSGNRTARAGVPLSNFASMALDPVGVTEGAPVALMTEVPANLMAAAHTNDITEAPPTQMIDTPETIINETSNELTAPEMPPAPIDGETVEHASEVYVL